MKKILCVVLSLIFLLGLSACGDGGNKAPKKRQLETYVEEKGEALKGVFAAVLRDNDTGLTWKSDIRLEENTIIIDFKIYEFDELSADERYNIQRTFTNIKSELEDSYEKYIDEMPELEYLIINIQEKDGDDVANVKIYC